MGWGPAPWTPVSISSVGGGSVWNFRAANSCGPPFTSFGYGIASAIKVVGDWDGAYNPDGHTQGVVTLQNGALFWSLSNYRQPSSPSYPTFAYGVYGDIPIVGDWDGNGTWTPGVYRGGTWLLSNINAYNPNPIVFGWGTGSETPVPGKWLASGANQPMTPGHVTLDPVGGGLKWRLRYANAPGGVDNEFGWGPWWGRPIAGDWWTGDGLTQFGPGFVTDEPPNACTSPPPTQLWTLKYVPSAGGIDAQFRYELNRP